MILVIDGLGEFVSNSLEVHRIVNELVIVGDFFGVNRLEKGPRILATTQLLKVKIWLSKARPMKSTMYECILKCINVIP